MPQVQLYDTTLRDGAQQEGISLSVADKLKIALKLDELGIHFIEGGWPGANPKDTEFFVKAQDLDLRHSVLVAFGSTKHPESKVNKDANLRTLVEAKTRVVTIVGKSWDLHVTQVLETSLENNLVLIGESVSYLKAKGLTVFFDAEHFFDGYKASPDYAIRTVEAATRAAVDCVVLCDTNGGALPSEVAAAIEAVRKAVAVPLGIHAHNDAEMAVANSLAGVQAGVVQVQGTINGYGERCGNANLCSVIPALKLKLATDCIADEQLAKLTEVSHYVAELANLAPASHLPYVGASAFTHKAGYHVAGIMKWEESYQHVNPEVVGNHPKVVVSELSGKRNIIYKARELGVTLPPQGKEARQILEQIKLLESRGFQYEGADASFELLLHRVQPEYKPPFELIDFMVLVERHRRPPSESESGLLSEATVKVKVGDRTIHTAAEGNGPVNALDQALRKALLEFYPDLTSVELVDYKVRILEESAGTASQVRVLIESSDGQEQWRTVGSSTNLIEASWLALADSMEYCLIKRNASV
ncbi:MAG: citramalate synthase [Dehalococcoidia bacterium]|nr:citramalate synthase [Dehalococcoidia bacterium]